MLLDIFSVHKYKEFSFGVGMVQARFSLWLFFFSSYMSVQAQEQTITVDVFQPQAQQYQQQLHLTGTIEAKQNADLAPLQSGVIAELFVDDGAVVKQGDKLLQLDATLAEFQLLQFQASAATAQVKKDEAQRLYDEVIALSKQQLIAKTLIGERRANLASAKAELSEKNASIALQQEVVNRHTLFAPFNGVIAARNADLGEWVSSQNMVFNLVANQALRLKVAVPQEYFHQLNNQPISVNVIADHQSESAFQADLSTLVTVSDPRTRTLIGLIDVPADKHLLAGMSAQAQIRILSGQNTQVWLPKSAIKTHPDGGSSVFAVIDNKAKRYLVNVHHHKGDRIAVSGVPTGKHIIVKGVELLVDGAAVSANVLKESEL